jgi:cytochrome c553
MEDYAHRWRNHKDMSPVAARLSDGERFAVAVYYAELGSGGPGLRPRPGGPALWLNGDPQRGLPPCARCHGPLGQGVGHAYPGLSSQPVEYISAQLQAFRQNSRRNDPQHVMGAVASKLTPEEVAAVSSFVAGLR